MSASTIMASSTHERIGKLLPLLGSDKDGEVVAAARAIERTLRPSGHMLAAHDKWRKCHAHLDWR